MRLQSTKSIYQQREISEAPSIFIFDDFRIFLMQRLEWIKSHSE